MYKVAFFDIDGTLMEFKTHRVPESTWRAIEAMRAQDIKVVVSTGRMPPEIPEEVREGFDSYVTFNGQLCYDAQGVFREVSIDEADVRAIVEGCRAGLYEITIMQRDRAFVSKVTPRVLEVSEKIGLLYVEDDLEKAFAAPVYQLNVFCDEEDDHLFLEKTSNVDATRWTELFADVVPHGGGKHLGVRAALERFGVKPEEAIAFGDGENDLSMFAEVGTSVAMGNAQESVKAQATYITTDVDDDGVWNACRHFGLV